MLRDIAHRMTFSPAILAALTLFGCDQNAVQPGETTATPDVSTATDATAATEDSAITSATDSATPADTTVPPEDTTAPPADTAQPGDTTTPPEDTVAPPEDTAVTDTGIVLPTTPPPIITTSSTFIGDWEMQPSAETTKCVVKRLDNEDELWVTRIRTDLAKGSHHLIIYKSAETTERTEPFDCDPFVQTLQGETFPLMITQIRQEELTFPNGVAFKFEPHQMVRLEAHYLNYFTEPITAHGEVRFDGIAASDVVSEANLLFYGTPDIDIAKGASVTTPWYYIDIFPGAHLFAATGHTHAYGTNVEITYSNNVDDEGTLIYPEEDAPFVWSEPPVAKFDPHLVFGEPGGKTGVRYRCSWTNTSSHHVSFGESAKAEMCFFWGYYYPSQGYRLCLSPGSIGNGLLGDSVCCGGTDESPFCDYVRQWAASAGQ
ncbi:MAG: hypothetical protein U1F43_16635 [Myxococcota bacterium]